MSYINDGYTYDQYVPEIGMGPDPYQMSKLIHNDMPFQMATPEDAFRAQQYNIPAKLTCANQLYSLKPDPYINNKWADPTTIRLKTVEDRIGKMEIEQNSNNNIDKVENFTDNVSNLQLNNLNQQSFIMFFIFITIMFVVVQFIKSMSKLNTEINEIKKLLKLSK